MSARKKNSIARQVRHAYRQEELARICTLPEYKFSKAFGMETVQVGQRWPADYYHIRDNGGRVLAVAHLDTVVRPDRRTPHFRNTQSGPFIQSGALDDRLGAYVILKLLPRFITCDWLLTVGEESCQSTAAFFTPPKEYDWIIEFDRMGTDVVMYQYEDKPSRTLVQASGARMGHGSYSDIGSLEHLDVKAFNWGVGYRGNYHSEQGYAYLYDTFTMVARYLRFHAQNAGTRLPHEQERYSYRDYRYADYTYRSEQDDCETCMALCSVDRDTLICTFCGTCQDCGEDQYDCTCYYPLGLRKKAAASSESRTSRAVTYLPDTPPRAITAGPQPSPPMTAGELRSSKEQAAKREEAEAQMREILKETTATIIPETA